MGYFVHEFILVLGYEEQIKEAHAKACEMYGIVSNIVCSGMNGIYSFMLAPDGSKEGWDLSYEMDKKRIAFVQWLNEKSFLYSWVKMPEQSEPFFEYYENDEFNC